MAFRYGPWNSWKDRELREILTNRLCCSTLRGFRRDNRLDAHISQYGHAHKRSVLEGDLSTNMCELVNCEVSSCFRNDLLPVSLKKVLSEVVAPATKGRQHPELKSSQTVTLQTPGCFFFFIWMDGWIHGCNDKFPNNYAKLSILSSLICLHL